MLRIKAFYAGILCIIGMVTTSCSVDTKRECVRSEIAKVIAVEAPSEGKVGETINMLVRFQVTDGCGDFGKFIESGSGKTRTIEVEAIHEGCICTDNLPVIDKSFQFTPESSGEFQFKFRSWQNEFITVTILVGQ